ncbi:unnamed protein product [Dovyalis caffra]|uniref:Peptidase M48 domain-containing protein n=1 Tax=Dovyalis caffra TaxID=77055 RepID=A0AAV1R5Q7_9ROSI|nr:unnamed protein product [Dovyalis caffra]
MGDEGLREGVLARGVAEGLREGGRLWGARELLWGWLLASGGCVRVVGYGEGEFWLRAWCRGEGKVNRKRNGAIDNHKNGCGRKITYASNNTNIFFVINNRNYSSHSKQREETPCFSPSLSMASVPLSSLCLAQRRRPDAAAAAAASLGFSFNYGISSDLRFRSGSVGFGLVEKNRRSFFSFFRNLDADDFRHPLDKQNTLILRAIPGLNELGKALLGIKRLVLYAVHSYILSRLLECIIAGSVTEQVMLLENIGTSVLVSKNQLSGLHQLMTEAAEILNIEPPDLYVRQSAVPNAYTLAISGKKPFVVVHTGLVELLTRKELQAVLAHELGHLKCDHGVWLTFANILTLGAYTVPGLGRLIAQSLEEQLFRWLRAAELTCDRAALLVAQDPKVVISVLMKLAGGSPSIADQLNVDAFLEQARSYDRASSSPVGWYIRNAQTRQLSHPLPVLRAREIDEWSRSPDYQQLLKRAIQMNTVHNV